MSEEIKLSSKNWDKFYESQGSQFFQLERKILKDHGKNQKTLFYKILNSTTKLIQVVGVVAGFGFTGLGFVENRNLFIFGEFFLFVTIFVGLLWIQKIYRLNINSSDKEVVRVKSIFKDRYSVFKKIYDKAFSDIKNGETVTVSSSLMDDLLKKNNELMEKFTDKEPEQKDWDPLLVLMILFIVGGGGLLASFVHFCIK
ncbi:MAG: hypothetical protein NTZ42_04605 [Candidatus Gribaldobacteria bacterium]|nr:hypothetical protein [Candidatus Gribaldobacteria bacterium]